MEVVRTIESRMREHREISGAIALPDFRPVSEPLATDAGALSIMRHNKTATEMQRRLPVTIELGLMAIVFSVLISVPAGVISAVKRNSIADYGARSFAIFALATPGFWLATLVIVWGSIWFN